MQLQMDNEAPVLPGRGSVDDTRKTVLWILVVFLVIGALIWWSYIRRSLSGEVTSTGPTLGAWTMRVNECSVTALAQPRRFTLTDSRQPQLKMTVTTDPQNPPSITVVSTRDGLVHTVEYDRCGTDTVPTEVPPSSHLLNGSVRLDCMVESSRLVADVDFENCH